MKLTLQLRLLPDVAVARALLETMKRFNQAANWLAGQAFERKLTNKHELQKLYYHQLRERFALSAQMAVRCIAQVAEAYKRDKQKRPTFRPLAAVPYDQRILSFKGEAQVSLLTLDGRVVVPYVMGRYQRERFDLKKGQCDVMRRHDGLWFLLVTVDVPDTAALPFNEVLGVDLGVVNLATDSDGESHSGRAVEVVRVRYHTRRQKLQKAASARNKRGRRPKNIRRALARMRRKEANFRRNENHRIAKHLVRKAKDTGRALALEQLQAIRDRTRFRKPQRARMAGWAFFQLRTFVAYKAALAGITLSLVEAAYTSRTCSVCGHNDKKNRTSQAVFCCTACGHHANADINAARNVRAKAVVNRPMVSKRGLTAASTGTSSAR